MMFWRGQRFISDDENEISKMNNSIHIYYQMRISFSIRNGMVYYYVYVAVVFNFRFVNKLFGCLYVDVVTDEYNFRFVNKLFARVMIGKLYSEINRFYSSACTTHPIFANFSESDSITTICVWWLTTLLFTMFSDPVIRVM